MLTPAQSNAIIAAPLVAASWRVGDLTPAQQTLIISAIGSAGMTIGAAVSGGTANRVLFVDGTGKLGQSAGLVFIDGDSLRVNNGAVSVTIGSGSYGANFNDSVYNVRIADGTNAISYTPAVAASWAGTAPADVWKALDRCAALLKVLNAGVGP